MKSSRRHTIKLVFISAALLLAGPSQAWDWGTGWGSKTVSGSGNIKSETRNVTGFTGIGLSLAADVDVRQGSSEGLTIETDDNILPLIETVVERGVLKIRPLEKNTNFRTKNMKIVVNAKTIESLAISGSGDIRADTLKSDKLKLSIGGAGNVRIKTLDVDSVNASIAGSGDVMLGGRANALDSSIAGSGDIKAGKLEAKTAKLSIAGSGSATIWARETLKVSIAGSGDVKYYGDAQVSKSVAGSGSIVRIGAGPE
jgi:Putative auto-transporter adhesin, head GIN domain